MAKDGPTRTLKRPNWLDDVSTMKSCSTAHLPPSPTNELQHTSGTQAKDQGTGPGKEEAMRTVWALKNSQAQGICKITPNVIKECEKCGLGWLTLVIQRTRWTEAIPEDWRREIKLPFYKGN